MKWVYTEEMVILKLLSAFISVTNLIYFKLHSKDETLNAVGIIITYILVSTTMASIDINLTSRSLILFAIVSLYSLFNNLRIKCNNKVIIEFNNVINPLVVNIKLHNGSFSYFATFSGFTDNHEN